MVSPHFTFSYLDINEAIIALKYSFKEHTFGLVSFCYCLTFIGFHLNIY